MPAQGWSVAPSWWAQTVIDVRGLGDGQVERGGGVQRAIGGEVPGAALAGVTGSR